MSACSLVISGDDNDGSGARMGTQAGLDDFLTRASSSSNEITFSWDQKQIHPWL